MAGIVVVGMVEAVIVVIVEPLAGWYSNNPTTGSLGTENVAVHVVIFTANGFIGTQVAPFSLYGKGYAVWEESAHGYDRVIAVLTLPDEIVLTLSAMSSL